MLDSRLTINTCEIPDVGTVELSVSSRAKYLRITIKPDRTIRLTVPKGVSFKKAKGFLDSKIPWINKHLRKFEELENNHEEVRLPEVSKVRARAILVKRLDELSELYDFRFNKVSIRSQKTKWGSCSSKNNISLNMNLARLPDELRDYVILHELVHTRIKNHSKKFWAELDEYTAGKARKFAKTLKTYRLGV
jgi:predicted metal-dependent hydrolase